MELKKKEFEKLESEIAGKYRTLAEELKKQQEKDLREIAKFRSIINNLKKDANQTIIIAKKTFGLVASRGWVKYLREKILIIGLAMVLILGAIGFAIHSRISNIGKELAESYYQTASIVYNRGESEEVVPILEQALKVNPKHKASKNLYGLVLSELIFKSYRAGQNEQAKIYLDKISKVMPLDEELKKLYDTLKIKR